jgi:LysR family transcriptional regulator, transcriptional activator of nhaA
VLNYRHLLYFHTVVREGSIARACERLHVSQPAVSAQLQKLEHSLGEKLLEKRGRTLVPTGAGKLAYEYADEIFSLGRELADALQARPTGKPLRLAVGVVDSLPKLVAYRLLQPALRLDEPVRLVLQDDRPDRLFAELSVNGLDLVLADAPLPPTVSVRAYNHLLGECGVSIFAAPALAARYRSGFPGSLEAAPFLLPTGNTALRGSLDQWLEAEGIRPRVVAEISDSSLLKTFGQAGMGVFAAPRVVEDEVRRQYRVEVVGEIPGVVERFYAISIERRLKHPAVVAISSAAREELFPAAPGMRGRPRTRTLDAAAARPPDRPESRLPRAR